MTQVQGNCRKQQIWIKSRNTVLKIAYSFLYIRRLLMGKRLFLVRYGTWDRLYISYDSDKRSIHRIGGCLENDNQRMFAPHQSIVVNNRIYSVHSFGLTILELGQNYADLHLPLAMGRPTTPTPVARPIRYGDKLFILCKDRLICRDY